MKLTGKEKRHDSIKDIVSKNDIESQDQILKKLEELGFTLTQATLSRDIRELKIAKTPDSAGDYYYRLPGVKLPQPSSSRHGMTSSFVRHGIINIEFSGQLAVIKTPAGYANGIAHDIEVNNVAGVMGTIAGTDTVLIILRENANKADLITSINILFAKR